MTGLFLVRSPAHQTQLAYALLPPPRSMGLPPPPRGIPLLFNKTNVPMYQR